MTVMLVVKVVQLTFQSDFNTERYRDVVNIYDGSDSSASLLTSISGYRPARLTYRSTGRYMYVTFTSDNNDDGGYSGFTATVNSVGKYRKLISEYRLQKVGVRLFVDWLFLQFHSFYQRFSIF